MTQITYIKGDATQPQGAGKKLIAHIVNDYGAWSAGFVVALDQRWDRPRDFYEDDFHQGLVKLGVISPVEVEPDITVVNMCAQRSLTVVRDGEIPLSYGNLLVCLDSLATLALQENASVHMPRIGCGIAGGNWDSVEDLIKQTLVLRDVPTFVYDYEPKK